MRLSLTRKQLESGPAIALLQLLEEITADGKVTDDELTKLNSWIIQNEQSDLPSVAYFKILLQEILADGKITPDERRSLQIAAERVLPTERREVARARRMAVESAAKIKAKTAQQDEQQLERERRETHRPTDYYDFMIAGVNYEGRAALIRAHLRIGDPVYLSREPENKYDRNAVAIRLSNGLDIGYVPREHAMHMAPLLDSGQKQKSYCKKLLGDIPIPVVVSCLHNSQAMIVGVVDSSQIPQRSNAPKTGLGCVSCGTLLIAFPAFVLLMLLFRC